MQTKHLKKKILLAFCLGSMFTATPAYAATETGYDVPENDITNSVGEFSITKTTADDIVVIGVKNDRKTNFMLSNNLVTITSGAVSTYRRAYTYGIANSGTTTLGGAADITVAATGGNANATVDVDAKACGIDNSGTITLGGPADIRVTATGGKVEATNDEYWFVNAYAPVTARGIYNDYGTTNIGGAAGITVAATGGSAKATASGSVDEAEAYAFARAYGIENIDKMTIDGAADITVTAAGGSANATASGSANADSSAVARGIYNDYGTTSIGGTADITVAATGGSANATASGYAFAYAPAVAWGIYNNAGTTSIGGAADVTAAATGGSATSAAATVYGIYNSGTISIGGATDITVTAIGGSAASASEYVSASAYASATGIYNSATTTIDEAANITVTATGGSVTGVNGGASARATGICNYSGTVSLQKNATITAMATARAGDAYAYSLNAIGGTIDINQAAGNPYTVKLTGDVLATGGMINLALNNSSSFLQGNVVNNGGTVNLTLANNAVWQPVYDDRNGTITYATDWSLSGCSITENTISGLNLSGGVIDLTWDDQQRTTYRKLNVTTLNGNGGTLQLNTDVANSTGDTASIGTLNSAAALKVAVTYDRSLSAITRPTTVYAAGYTPVSVIAGTSNLTLIGVTTESGAFSLTPSFSGTSLTSLAIGSSSNTKAAASIASSQANMLQTSVNHLRKRLGDLRAEPETETGIWARIYSGEVSNDKYTSIESAYKGMQLGYDKSREVKDGRTYIGGAVNYTKADNSFARGSGESKDCDLALYQTWIGNDGHYYDLIAKQGRLTSDYHVTDQSDNYSTADYHTRTSSLSAEYGYRKQLKDGWYLEPQVELSYGHINGVNYTTSAGMSVKQVGIDRLIGRLGLGLGKKLASGSSIFTSLSVLHEFNGDENIKADTLTYSQDMGGTWYEFILGASSKMSNHSTGYINVEKLFGGYVGSDWQVNAGCRWNF